MPFNWFDLVILLVLFLGCRRGRKHGMSDELPKLLKWLAIMCVSALAYKPLGQLIVTNSSVFSELAAYLMAYLGTALLIAAVFAVLKSALGEKWVSGEVFGRSEFYLGMVAGGVRFCCILMIVLALVNARAFNAAEVNANVNYQKAMYGSDFFPTFHTFQSQIFEKSLLGPSIKRDLGFLLIEPTAPEKKQLKRKELNLP
jgi:uncharacterized membrane protein required for colicin V production